MTDDPKTVLHNTPAAKSSYTAALVGEAVDMVLMRGLASKYGFQMGVGDTAKIIVEGIQYTLPREQIEGLLKRPLTQSDAVVPLDGVEAKLARTFITIRAEVLDNDTLSDMQKNRILQRVSAMSIALIPDSVKLAGIKELRRSSEVVDWMTLPPRLERADGSMLHKLSDAIAGLRVDIPVDPDIERMRGMVDALRTLTDGAESFVIAHDWGGVLADAEDADGGELALPYEKVAFEFVLSGRRVICLVSEAGGLIIAQTDSDHWFLFSLFAFDGVSFTPSAQTGGTDPDEDAGITATIDFILRNVRAVLIMLDAQVAETEVVRAPHKLNRARERRGKLPISDYHVVTLKRAGRPRPLAAPFDPDRTITRKRLHFRRSHWRYYENHKTRIQWMLVGNPDLGFIDKEYRL